jgi:hypothetical protein
VTGHPLRAAGSNLDEATLTRYRRIHGGNHPHTLNSASNLAADRPERRDRGILGLGILATILVSLLLLTLHEALGDW